MAGCPVTLNAWVSRSITLRTGWVDDPTWTVLAPMSGAGIGQRRQHQRIVLRERGVHFARQRFAADERANVVFRQHVASHFQPQAHRFGVPLRHRVERGRVIRGRIRQLDVQIDRSDVSRVRDLDVVDADARRA